MEVKSVATFSVVLVKLATSPLPPQTKLNFEQMGGMTAFSGHNIAGGVDFSTTCDSHLQSQDSEDDKTSTYF